MSIMTGMVIDKDNNVGIIEDSYYSKQIQKRIYKVRFFDKNDDKIRLQHYKFIAEGNLRSTELDNSIFSWNNTILKKMLDNTYQASIIYKNQLIKCNDVNDVTAFDKLVDKISILKRK